MSQPTHLPLAARKRLYARQIGLREIELTRIQNTRREVDIAFTTMTSDLVGLTAKYGQISDKEPLDKFVHEFATEVVQKTSPLCASPCGHEVGPVVVAIESAARSISCASCTGGSPVCDGGLGDHALVADHGYCMAFLFELFDIAIGSATTLYASSSAEFGKLSMPKVLFSTEVSAVPTRIPDAGIWVGGATEFPEPGTSLVRLGVNVDKFDWRSYLATLYVLIHECVAHVFQALVGSGSASRMTKPHDPFTEGWMDWLAFREFESVLALEATTMRLDLVNEHRRVGSDLHNRRHNVRHRNRLDDSLHWNYGRLAAEKFLRFLRSHGPTREDALAWHRRISVELNLIAGHAHAKEQFVYAVFRSVPDGLGRPPDTTYARAIEAALARYEASNEILDLVSEWEP